MYTLFRQTLHGICGNAKFPLPTGLHHLYCNKDIYVCHDAWIQFAQIWLLVCDHSVDQIVLLTLYSSQHEVGLPGQSRPVEKSAGGFEPGFNGFFEIFTQTISDSYPRNFKIKDFVRCLTRLHYSPTFISVICKLGVI